MFLESHVWLRNQVAVVISDSVVILESVWPLTKSEGVGLNERN